MPTLPPGAPLSKKVKKRRKVKPSLPSSAPEVPETTSNALELLKSRAAGKVLLRSPAQYDVDIDLYDSLRVAWEMSNLACKAGDLLLAAPQPLDCNIADIAYQPLYDYRRRLIDATRTAVPMLNQKGANVCFANSVLQLLCATSPFLFGVLQQAWPWAHEAEDMIPLQEIRDFCARTVTGMDSEPFALSNKDESLLSRWQQLLKREPGMEEDAPEFAMFVLDVIGSALTIGKGIPDHTESELLNSFNTVGKSGKAVKSVKHTAETHTRVSLLENIFEGTLVHIIEKKKTTEHTEPFYILPLPLNPRIRTIHGLLAEFTKDSGGGYQTKLESLPPVLLLQVPRSQFDPARMAVVKSNQRVAFPDRLVLDEGYLSPRAQLHWSPEMLEQCAYELSAIICHLGNCADAGHYVTFVRRGSNWFHCDDLTILEGYDETIVETSGYLAAYEMRNCVPVSPVAAVASRCAWTRYLRVVGT